MTALPPKWVMTSLGNVCEILDSKRVPINQKERKARIDGRLPESLFPYYGATGQVDVIDDYLFEGEHVLVGEDGAPFLDPFRHKAYVVDGKFWVNNHAHILRAYGSNKYLSHYLNSIRFDDHVSGTTRLKLTKRALTSIPIALPPDREQHRIIDQIEALFDEIDRGVESLRAAKKAIGLYRQSLLKAAFEGRLTADWRAKNPDKLESPEALLVRIHEERESAYNAALDNWLKATTEWKQNGKEGKKPTRPKFRLNIEAKHIPDELNPAPAKAWGNLRLGELNTCVSDGPFGSKLKTRDYTSTGIRVIRLENIGDGNFLAEKRSFISQEKYETIKKHTVLPGTIVVSSFVTEGVRSCVVPTGVPISVNKADCFAVTLFGEQTNRRFLAYFLQSRRAFDQIKGLVHGVGRPRINTTQLKELHVPVCSLTEQAEIVRILDERLEAAEVLDCEIDANLPRADALRQSILKKAFSGQLVPQDPTDEPASALLTRIRAGHTTTTAKRSRGRAEA